MTPPPDPCYGLLVDDPATVATARDRIREPMERVGISLLVHTNPAEALTELTRGSPHARAPVLLLVGPSVARAVDVARGLHRAAPLAPLVFLHLGTSAVSIQHLESPVSMIGTDWQLLDLGSTQLAETIRAAAETGRKRQRLRTTLDRFNVRLATSVPTDPSQLRRYTISHRFLASILENAQDGIISANDAGTIVTWNRAASRILGLPAKDAIGCSLADVSGGEWAERIPEMIAEAQGPHEATRSREVRCRRPDGSTRHVEVGLSVIRTELGGSLGLAAIVRDIEERKRLEVERVQFERQMLQAQKLESLGMLAGGVAHDFNNLLTGVLGQTDLALHEVLPTSPARVSLEEIRKAALRAAGLCQQMLAYSGRGRFVVEPIHLNEIVDDLLPLLRASISKTVVIRTQFADDLPATEADVTQVRQVLMNVISNAAESVGEAEGTVTVRTASTFYGEQELADGFQPNDLEPSVYVTIEVSDTGCGMNAATLQRMFDPFFTTKFVGRGLGLAAVQGIVRGHRGAIGVRSVEGRGTIITVLFRPSDKTAAPLADERWSAEALRGSGTILVVDDEEVVRSVAQRTLEDAGYDVLIAADGREAVARLREGPAVSLVILDLTMPGLVGEPLLSALRQVQPNVPIIMMSGYSEDEVVEQFAHSGVAGFLQKPFKPSSLLHTVAAVTPPDRPTD